MKRLGIEIVRYDWNGSQPIFKNVKKAIYRERPGGGRFDSEI